MPCLAGRVGGFVLRVCFKPGRINIHAYRVVEALHLGSVRSVLMFFISKWVVCASDTKRQTYTYYEYFTVQGTLRSGAYRSGEHVHAQLPRCKD